MNTVRQRLTNYYQENLRQPLEQTRGTHVQSQTQLATTTAANTVTRA